MFEGLCQCWTLVSRRSKVQHPSSLRACSIWTQYLSLNFWSGGYLRSRMLLVLLVSHYTGKLTDFLISFRSSVCIIQQPVPRPPFGVLLTTQVESGTHPHQVCSFTYQFESWWLTYHDRFWITYSPITLSNFSSIHLVSIFRCSSPCDTFSYDTYLKIF